MLSIDEIKKCLSELGLDFLYNKYSCSIFSDGGAHVLSISPTILKLDANITTISGLKQFIEKHLKYYG